MNNRSQCIQTFTLPTPAKTLCAKFGFQTQSIMVSADDKNMISLWRLNKNEPKTTIDCSKVLQEKASSSISYVCFAPSEYEVYSGTTQGSLYLWDIRNQKLSQTFQGHDSKITYIIPSNMKETSNMALTGSSDTTVRQWDTRQRNSVAIFSGHSAGITCIDLSPNGENFATGSEDGELKLWDIRTQKCMETFSMGKTSVVSIGFNPEEIALAAATSDGSLKYYDLDRFELSFDAKGEKNSIQQIFFGLDAKYIFTAGQKTLKVWEVNAQNLILLDQIQTQGMDIQDLRSQKTAQGQDETAIHVTISPSFGLWASSGGSFNKDPKKALAKFDSLKTDNEIPNEMGMPQIKGNMIKNSNYINFNSSQFAKLESPYQNQQGGSPQDQKNQRIGTESGQAGDKIDETKLNHSPDRQKLSPSDNKAPLGDTHPDPGNDLDGDIKGEEEKGPVDFEGEDIEVESFEENLQINELLESTRTMMESLIQLEKNSPSDLDLESYIKGITNEEKNREYDIISEIRADHAKFKASMIQRGQNVKTISDKWKTPYAAKTVPTIDNLQHNDCPMIISLINASVVAHRLEKVPLDVVCALLRKTPLLLQTSSEVYMLIALGFILASIDAFKKDVIPRPAQTPKKIESSEGRITKASWEVYRGTRDACPDRFLERKSRKE